MAAITICSDFGAQENEKCHCFLVSPSIWHDMMGPDAMILGFWMLSFKPSDVYQFSSVTQSCPTLWPPWTAACQASLSITNSQSLPKLMSIESVLPSKHLTLCCPLLLLPLIFPSNKVFSSESVLHIRWPNYWSFSFNISPSNEYSVEGLMLKLNSPDAKSLLIRKDPDVG